MSMLRSNVIDTAQDARIESAKASWPPQTRASDVYFWGDVVLGTTFFSALWPATSGVIVIVAMLITEGFDVWRVLNGFICIFFAVPVFGALTLCITAGVASMVAIAIHATLRWRRLNRQTVVGGSWVGGLTGLIVTIPWLPTSESGSPVALLVMVCVTPLCQVGGTYGGYRNARSQVRYGVEIKASPKGCVHNKNAVGSDRACCACLGNSQTPWQV